MSNTLPMTTVDAAAAIAGAPAAGPILAAATINTVDAVRVTADVGGGLPAAAAGAISAAAGAPAAAAGAAASPGTFPGATTAANPAVPTVAPVSPVAVTW